MINAKGMKLFAVIDQSAEARRVGLSLRETTLVTFGSPAAGTPVMAAAPLAALDLPLKVLVWADEGRTKGACYAQAALAARHHLGPDLAGNLWSHQRAHRCACSHIIFRHRPPGPGRIVTAIPGASRRVVVI